MKKGLLSITHLFRLQAPAENLQVLAHMRPKGAVET
jgi:hypothetical protein